MYILYSKKKKKGKEKKEKNSRGVVLNQEQIFHPRDNIWKQFWLSKLGDCYRHPVGRGQDDVAEPHTRHGTAAHNKGLSTPVSVVPQLRNPALREDA